MTWSFETVGLTLGLMLTAAYFFIGLVKTKPTDLGSIISIFSAVYASVTAIEIIPAVVSGGDISDVSQLTPLWPVYVILGIIAIFYFSLDHVISRFKELFRKPAQTRADETASKKNGAKPPDSRE